MEVKIKQCTLLKNRFLRYDNFYRLKIVNEYHQNLQRCCCCYYYYYIQQFVPHVTESTNK